MSRALTNAVGAIDLPSPPRSSHAKRVAPPPMSESREADDHCAIVYLKRGDKIPALAVEWTWKWYLARGKLHLFAGPAGIGKTSVLQSIAAAITTGGCFPDGTRASRGSVILWTGEDDLADTSVPRMIGMGADMSRVYFVHGASEDGKSIAFDPSIHMEGLRRMAGQVSDLSLIMIDPVMSSIRGDSNKAGDVRRGLAPLQQLAEHTKSAVVGISHFSKGSQGKDPLERVTGSQAFGAVARIVYAAAKRKDEGDHVFLRVKSNIGPVDGGFSYVIDVRTLPEQPEIETSVIRWTGVIDGNARDVLHSAEASDEDGGSMADAKEFLRGLLSDGPRETKFLQAEANGAGHSWATIRRAQVALGIKTEKASGPGGKWRWALPQQP